MTQHTPLPKAAIFGIKGPVLTSAEEELFAAHNPLGFILFERNCQSPVQVRQLVEQLKKTVGRDNVPILIDQEGGRVQRLKPPVWRKYPAARLLSDHDNSETSKKLIYKNSWLIGNELDDLNVNVNCAPVADLPLPDAHPIIGDRAYGTTPSQVADFCLAAIQGFIEAGITPVIKHLPGHGRALVDSHEQLPVVDAPSLTLLNSDFSAFINICNYFKGIGNLQPYPWGMTAHVVYSTIDPEQPATFSRDVIDGVIRNFIGFEGFLISDCLTMKALSGSYSQRAEKALHAGCDSVLHCSGDFTEMKEICEHIPSLSNISYDRYLKSLVPSHLKKLYTPEVFADEIDQALTARQSNQNILNVKEQEGLPSQEESLKINRQI